MKKRAQPTPDHRPPHAAHAQVVDTASPSLRRLPSGSVLAAPKQGNHDAFCRPAGLDHLVGAPLYLLAAHWGVLTGTDLTVASVGQAFHIDTRRAREVLRYFLRYETNVTFLLLGRSPLCLRIIAVRSATTAEVIVAAPEACPTEVLPPGRKKRKTGNVSKQEETRAQMRRWFLQHPNLSVSD